MPDRELDVLRHVARGLSNTEIAATLLISEATVKTHLAHAMPKLGHAGPGRRHPWPGVARCGDSLR